MSNQTQTPTKKSPPVYRLCFSAKNGTDRNGLPTLAYPVEIGAVFERRERGKGLIAKFSIIPTELKDGVLFLMPADADRRQESDLFEADSEIVEAGQ
ncbi:hypothetical protein [Maricaulis alexandrii]|uniref:hypothetical protein n=1 Tax=Maricaulis alexandrii TaxID=2570354 RepID=UPI0011093E34|nr:hypothetical protein [Maricaulis alexandrii]